MSRIGRASGIWSLSNSITTSPSRTVWPLVKDALTEMGCTGLTIYDVQGHGTQKGIRQEFRGKTYKVEFMTKARLQVIVNDADVDKTVKAIQAAAWLAC